MNHVSKIFSIVLFVFCQYTLLAQSTSEKLKKEQASLEKKISNTKSMLGKVKTNTETSLNELRLIENQIKLREELVRNYDYQVRGAEMKIVEKSDEVKTLQAKMAKLKEQYKYLLLYAYKHRNKYGKMMFLFSSSNYNEAMKRNRYLTKVAEMQEKQFRIIKQNQKLIAQQIETIKSEKETKLVVLEGKKQEKVAIENDKKRQEVTYEKFRKEESNLMAALKQDEKKKALLKQKISAAIKKEIAIAEEKARKAEAAAKKKADAAKTKSNTATTTKTTNTSTNTSSNTNTETKAVEKPIVFTETSENVALSKSFEGNKGKLPWPVSNGNVTEGFGKNAHPTLPNVYTNNNGVDISSPKNSQVRAVFEGEVTSILNIPGAGKVVIIKHGNYRTVYSNLQDTYVQTGSKVSTKQAIGSLLVAENSSISELHFEIHQVIGSVVQSLNPSLWISK